MRIASGSASHSAAKEPWDVFGQEDSDPVFILDDKEVMSVDEVIEKASTNLTHFAFVKSKKNPLTDSVPLKGYKPILWRAETEVEKVKHKTIVQFYGPLET